MSAGAQTLRVGPRFTGSSVSATSRSASRGRSWIQLFTFAALALYGVIRWATLLHPAPTWRLAGLLALSVALAGVVPLVSRVGRPLGVAVAVALALAALPVAGLPWEWFHHVRIAVGAGHIGDGLQALPAVLVPYIGPSQAVRLVIVLGAAVLLLDGAVVAAFAPRSFGDGRRAGAALPLVALAVVPSTLVRPQLPYLQGLLMFGLLAAFMWGDRVRRDAAGAAVLVAALAGVGAAIAAPRIDPRKPWVNYRAWAGTLRRPHVDSFNWNQTYGPLHWPKTGHVVLTVRARQGDYWKAADLDQFNGFAWQQGPAAASASDLPLPDRAAVARWTQRLGVTIQGMRTASVIAAGYAAKPTIASATVGVDVGTWDAGQTLGPGTSYQVLTYSPSPSAAQLRGAGRAYPAAALAGYRMLRVPTPSTPVADFPAVVFAPFHSRREPSIVPGPGVTDPAGVVQSSPYAAAYALARQLAAQAPTPYAFVRSVQQYLSQGYKYNQSPPIRRYPLESFLFQDRIGYCQQFSGAMALLLRMGGIPARVAAGFTSGTFDSASHEWTVTDVDAHAWVEVWFPHYGWVRFDPTPAVAPARAGTSDLPFVKNLPGESAASLPGSHGLQASPAVGPRSHPAATAAGASPLLIVPALLVLLVLAVFGRSLLRPAPSDRELVAELERAMARSGRPLHDGVTLAALEQRFHDSPAAAAYIRSLRLARYGGGPCPSASGRRALRQQLRQGLGLVGRLRALWALPPRPAIASKRRTSS